VASNVEIKARYPDLQHALRVCEQIGAVFAGTDRQLDSYFRVPSGRLKIRESSLGPNSLILYRREDKESPKESCYVLVDVGSTAASLRELLAQALGMTVQVKKKRRILMYGQTRIHLDEVEHLGSFVEFEYVLQDNESPEAGISEVERLRSVFGIDEAALVSGSYSDLAPGSGL
jgi:predicted adenylyl cyclase CyaB